MLDDGQYSIQTLLQHMFALGMSIILIIALSGLLERQIENVFIGKATRTSFFEKIWLYILFPMLFAITGVGMLLYPNADIQRALTQPEYLSLIRSNPLDKTIHVVSLFYGKSLFTGAFLGGIILMAVSRIIIVTYSSAVINVIYLYFLAATGTLAIAFLINDSSAYAHLLIDHVLVDKLNAAVNVIIVALAIGILTEGALAFLPNFGIRVGQRPGTGTYVCKTCSKSQRLRGHTAGLENCAGGCDEPIFRRVV